jgi:hypothetical protein
MTRKSPREIEHEVSKLREEQPDGDDATAGVTVEWRDAEPESRPEGFEWNPDAGTLTYDAWQAQRDTLSALTSGERDIVAFLAGYGSGKSVFGARWLIGEALAHPGSRFLAMGVDFTKARDATFRVLFEQLPGERTGIVTSTYNGPEESPIVSHYDRQHHRLTLANDTVIKLGSADKWSRHAGDEYGGVWLDEPSHYGEDLHDLLEMIGSRLRGVAGPKVQLWTLTGNGYNAAWEILEEQQDANGDPLGLDIEQIRASTLENPYLADADKERFERQYADTDREEQALHGGFAAATGLVYAGFSRDSHVIPGVEADEMVETGDEWRVFGYDAGWNDPRVVLEVARNAYDQLIVVDEYYRSGSHVEDAVGWLEREEKPVGTVHCEHEPADIQKFAAAGWDAVRADKSIDAGISAVRRRFESDDDGRPGLLIAERCENLIRELLGYKEDHVGSASAEDHACDALRYLIMGVERGGSGDEWSGSDVGLGDALSRGGSQSSSPFGLGGSR